MKKSLTAAAFGAAAVIAGCTGGAEMEPSTVGGAPSVGVAPQGPATTVLTECVKNADGTEVMPGPCYLQRHPTDPGVVTIHDATGRRVGLGSG